MSPLVFVALGLVLLAAGLVLFFYPKPPPLDFTAFLGGHPRLYVSLICIVLGGGLGAAGTLDSLAEATAAQLLRSFRGTLSPLPARRGGMTTQQLHLFNGIGLIVLLVVAVLTRATLRRIAGALAGGAVFGVVALGIIALGEEAGWWHMAITWEPYFLTLLWIDFALCAYLYLITWRIARRFGWRGLAVVVTAAAVIGPPRDYWYMERFPEWGAYGPGIAPVLAVSATYVVMVLLGHGVMRLVAGPARADRLARRPWEAAEPSAAADRSRHSGSHKGKADEGGPGG